MHCRHARWWRRPGCLQGISTQALAAAKLGTETGPRRVRSGGCWCVRWRSGGAVRCGVAVAEGERAGTRGSALTCTEYECSSSSSRAGLSHLLGGHMRM